MSILLLLLECLIECRQTSDALDSCHRGSVLDINESKYKYLNQNKGFNL